jgi:uncharacterized protein YqcC (DUF446 family)
MSVHQQLKQALRQLESSMETIGLWQMASPPASAFESVEPFCVDTMDIPQWLRFVFIARLDALAEARGPMPANCDVAPAVEAYLVNAQLSAEGKRQLCQAVAHIDRLVTDN